MKKGGFLRNVLDTIRSNQATGHAGRGGSTGSASERNIEYGGQLKPSHFSLGQVARHGFPEHPTALAFDPVQKIAAIGTKSGALRIFGRPGVDVWAQHEPAFAVTHIRFIVNQGAIITVTSDESVHLWSLRGPNLKLQLSSNSNQTQCNSPQASGTSTTSGNVSSMHTASQSNSTTATNATATLGGGLATAASPSSLLGQITDTVSGAVDSASDFLSGGGGNSSAVDPLTPSPTGDSKQFVSRQPEVLHTLKFQREHITYIHQTLLSKWLYIGTERGNVHVANVETFELSGYSIAWNKAIELSRKTHPGAIIHLSECPQDTNKLLIGYASGCIVLWDLKQRSADGRYYHADNLLWLAWHYEGKQFVAAHGDGSLITWLTRSNSKPANILHPHAKMPAAAGYGGAPEHAYHQQQQQLDPATNQQPSLGSSVLARSLNNELYRPINKVEWKTSKSNEQFLLFSGGLPYDGLDQLTPSPPLAQDPGLAGLRPGLRQSAGGQQSPARFTPDPKQQHQQQFLKATSPATMASPSPSASPSISPGLQQQQQFQDKSSNQLKQHSQKKCLRSTSLTVMLGKSITVLEMENTIVDFITICDHSPYENDTSDPYAVIVLLSNELILIDLTSPGYPSFESPYPSTGLSESPVTCVEYLADCNSSLIPYLYSHSQNVISRAPKKGFSDKEWPINGGEWGQSLQSYPELVLTGHADGTIKFWDMSGVNFDLISKIKTSKLFERPKKPPNAIFVSPHWQTSSSSLNQQNANNNNNNNNKRGSLNPLRLNSPSRGASIPNDQQQQQHDHYYQQQHSTPSDIESTNQTAFEDNYFAIEKIKFCPNTRHLLVAAGFSQVIQFRLNKKETHPNSEIATILVEPTTPGSSQMGDQTMSNNGQPQLQQQQPRQHLLFRVKDHQVGTATGSSSGGSSSSNSSHRTRLSGFQPEIVCLTPLLISPAHQQQPDNAPGGLQNSASTLANIDYYCHVPPKITALALQETHNILAYAHEAGVVLIDIIQKCVVMNATLGDLYGGGGSLLSSQRDISIQPFATNSILQHHYQSVAAASSPLASSVGEFNYGKLDTVAGHHQQQAAGELDNGGGGGSATADHDVPPSGGGAAAAAGLAKSGATADASSVQAGQMHPKQQQLKSRYTTNSMFQRQLSTNALNLTGTTTSSSSSNSNNGPTGHPPANNNGRIASIGSGSGGGGGVGPRGLFQRQMTATQLVSSSSSSSNPRSAGQQQLDGKHQRSARGEPLSALTNSSACLATPRPASGPALADHHHHHQQQQQQAKKTAKNKRIISRMLSISAIHTTVGASSDSDDITAHSNDSASTTTTTGIGPGGEQSATTAAADKFDSSFTRSRSSSSSSTTAPADPLQQHQHHGGQAAGPASGGGGNGNAPESIQCLVFLDPASALPAASGQLQQQQHQHQVQSSAGPSHKSLSSIDTSQLALWLGTSTGAVLLVSLSMPDNEDNRVLQLQSITAEPIPQASVKLPGSILCLEPFVCESRPAVGGNHGANVSSSSSAAAGQTAAAAAAASLEASEHQPNSNGGPNSVAASPPGGGGGGAQLLEAAHHLSSLSSAGSSFDSRYGLFLAIVSEKQARVYQVPANWNQQLGGGGGASAKTADHQHHKDQHHHHHQSAKDLPHQQSSSSGAGAAAGADTPLARLLINKANLFAKCELSESSFAAKSQLVQMRTPDESCLVSYLATGTLVVHALPRLRPSLLEADFVPYSSPLVARSMCLSRQGHCLFQPSPGELAKFTVSAQYKALVNEMTGHLFVQRDMPEMPRANFFKSLFSVSQAAKQSDRDELFGDTSAGRPNRGVANRQTAAAAAEGAAGGPGGRTPGALDKLKGAAAGTMGHDMRVAREGLDERGEKLGEIEDRTLQMLNQSESYAQAAHQLAQKFKDKKWYQF